MSRRQMLWGAGGAGMAAMAGTVLPGCPMEAMPEVNFDPQILNFALNLEYLEAEYYLRAFGETLAASEIGSNPGAVTGGRAVNFEREYFRQYAREIADDERNHVRFLRNQLGAAAVDRPAIDLDNSFNAAAQAAGLGDSFDPYASDVNFLIGAFLFEDVGVTAYKGAAPLIKNSVFLEAAAGILAVEAYHAGTIRSSIWGLGDPDITINLKAFEAYLKAHTTETDAISDARDSLDGNTDLDQPIAVMSGGQAVANIVPSDSNGIAFSRSISQVLRIVYLTPERGVAQGGFFPNGVNGTPAFSVT